MRCLHVLFAHCLSIQGGLGILLSGVVLATVKDCLGCSLHSAKRGRHDILANVCKFAISDKPSLEEPPRTEWSAPCTMAVVTEEALLLGSTDVCKGSFENTPVLSMSCSVRYRESQTSLGGTGEGPKT